MQEYIPEMGGYWAQSAIYILVVCHKNEPKIMSMKQISILLRGRTNVKQFYYVTPLIINPTIDKILIELFFGFIDNF